MTLGSRCRVCLPGLDACACVSGGFPLDIQNAISLLPRHPQAVHVTFEAVLGISRVYLRMSVVRGP